MTARPRTKAERMAYLTGWANALHMVLEGGVGGFEAARAFLKDAYEDEGGDCYFDEEAKRVAQSDLAREQAIRAAAQALERQDTRAIPLFATTYDSSRWVAERVIEAYEAALRGESDAR